MPKSSYIPFIIGLVAVFAICCLAISGSFSTTLREGYFDPDVKTSGVLGIGRKAPDVSVSRWEGQPMRAGGSYTGKLNEDALGIPISSNPTSSGNYTLTNEQCPAIPRPTKWGTQGCMQFRNKGGGGQCGSKVNGAPASWCDYNPAPSINGGKPLCVIENQCSKGNLCDLETQRCATPDSDYILVETQTQCPLKPTPSQHDPNTYNTPNANSDGPDNLPTQTCGKSTGAYPSNAPWNNNCPKICQAPGRLGWDSGIGTCQTLVPLLFDPGAIGGDLQKIDDLAGASCTNANTQLPQKCAFKQSCPRGQLCDMTKNKCMALCKKGDEKCKTEAMGPPPPLGTHRPAWAGPTRLDPSCKDAASVSFPYSALRNFISEKETKAKYGCVGGTCTTTCAMGMAAHKDNLFNGRLPQALKDACPITLKTGCDTMPRAPPPVRKDCPSLRGWYPGWALNIRTPGKAGAENDDTRTCEDLVKQGGAWSDPPNIYKIAQESVGLNCYGCSQDAQQVPEKRLNPWGQVGQKPDKFPPRCVKACADKIARDPNMCKNWAKCDTSACEDSVAASWKVYIGNNCTDPSAPPSPQGARGYPSCLCASVERVKKPGQDYDDGIGRSGSADQLDGDEVGWMTQKQCRYSMSYGLPDPNFDDAQQTGMIGSGCSGRGVCTSSYQMSGQCVCDKGYTGIDCSVKVGDPSANVIPASLPPAWCGWMDPAVAPGSWETSNPERTWMKKDGWASADAPSPIGVSATYCAEKPPRGWTKDFPTRGKKDGGEWAVLGLDGDYKHMIAGGCVESTFPTLKVDKSIPGCKGYVGGSSPPPSGGSSPPPSGGSSPPPSGGSSPPPSGGSSPPPSGGSSPPPSGGSSPSPSGGSSPSPSGGQINRYAHRNGRTYKKGQYQPAPNPHFHLQTPGPAYTCKAGQQWCVALQKCSLLNDCPK